MIYQATTTSQKSIEIRGELLSYFLMGPDLPMDAIKTGIQKFAKNISQPTPSSYFNWD